MGQARSIPRAVNPGRSRITRQRDRQAARGGPRSKTRGPLEASCRRRHSRVCLQVRPHALGLWWNPEVREGPAQEEAEGNMALPPGASPPAQEGKRPRVLGDFTLPQEQCPCLVFFFNTLDTSPENDAKK